MELKQTGFGRYGLFGKKILSLFLLLAMSLGLYGDAFRTNDPIIHNDLIVFSSFWVRQVDFKRKNSFLYSLPNIQISEIFSRGKDKLLLDNNGNIVLNQDLVRAYSSGFVYEVPNVDFDLNSFKEAQKNKGQKVRQLSLDDLIPRPKNPDPSKINLLLYPKYNIRVPIIYTEAKDFYHTNPDGSIDFNRPFYRPDMTPFEKTQIPIQIKLRDGVVHLTEEVYPYSVMPGEIGNSYIVGHSSNYNWVKSNYNEVFKPIERKSQVGEEFIIFDQFGRELKFVVFEVLLISESDIETAFKLFEGRRVVTLQTSVLTRQGGVLLPTHRWLTRGELVLE